MTSLETTSMLVVQRIKTEWTKASRGGEGATTRNATPEAARLPRPSRATSGYLLHDIRYREWDNFEGQADVRETEGQTSIRIEPLLLHISKKLVTVRFHWSWQHCGAPERNLHELFQLSPGQWGRFMCNGRFGAQSSRGDAWTYHKTVFNIALIEVFDEDLFTKTSPDAVNSQLAVLR